MPYDQLDRRALAMRRLGERPNRVYIEHDRVLPTDSPGPLSPALDEAVHAAADDLRAARQAGSARMLTFGAHTIKNGLAPVLAWLIEQGWISHLATNGAGIIHDWEFAYQGASSEDVRVNIAEGAFGAWEETNFYINLAIDVGAYRGLGYGESVGAFVENDGLEIPSTAELMQAITAYEDGLERAAAAADLLAIVHAFDLHPGALAVPHPFKRFGLQAAAYRLGVPFTGHPMIGHDIIYLHPMNCCAAIGRTAERDFLQFAHSVGGLGGGGVYLSVGSAVMSPMVFEKSLSMAQNLAIQGGTRIENHRIYAVDLAPSQWDWSKGEPPEHSPDYYLRYNKTFARMGGSFRYVCADNRQFLLALVHALQA
ncbi:MAG: hypothetical protein WD873_03330 [Candidatus Hydrogenedentales bacterium]